MKSIWAVLDFRRRPAARMSSRFSPWLEKLEDRTLLSVTVDSSLEERVEFHLDNDTSARHGVAISNITTGDSIVVNTEADDVYGTSSTIKLGVLYTLLRKIDADNSLTLNTVVDIGSDYGTTAGRGDLTANEDLTLRELAEHMIDTSDNWAANRLMDFVEDRYDFNNDTWGAPGTFPTSNAEFASLGLNSTRLDRYNTGTFSPSAHALAGPVSDYKAGFDNETTPDEIASLLEQVHENNGLLNASSYDAYWEILNLNAFPQTTADYRDATSPDDDGIIAGTGGSGNWQSLMTFYTKSGSNTWTGNVGDFINDPTIGNHFQRSEAGRVELANGEVLVYGIFADESNSSTADQTTRANIGYEFAVEFADPFISFTPSGAELDDGRVLTVNMANFMDGGDGSGDDVKIRKSGPDLVIDVNSDEVYRAIFSEIDLLRVFGSSDDDNFIVDFSGGDPIPADLNYDGGTGFDSLTLTGGSFTTTTYNYTNASDGNIDLDGSTINYSNLSPINANINAATVILNYTGGAETIAASNAGGGQTAVNSTLGEATSFNHPTENLTINAGTGNDTVNVNGLAASYPAHVSVNGGAGVDSVNFDGAIHLGAGEDLTVNADSISFNSASITTGGNQTYNGDIDLTVSVTTTGADIDFNNTVDLGGNELTINTSSAGSTANGIISGAGDLTKEGAGTLTLAANNAYQGETNVDAGVLALIFANNNNIAASQIITVAAGATLDVTGLNTGRLELSDLPDAGGNVLQLLQGTGTLTGDVTALSGSSIGPGISPGIFTANGDVTLNGGSTFAVEVDGAAGAGVTGGHDQLIVTGDVSLDNATLALSNSLGGTPDVPFGDTLVIIRNDGNNPVDGMFADLPEGACISNFLGTGLSAVITYTGGDGNDVELGFGIFVSNGTLFIIGTSDADDVTISQQGQSTLKVHADFLPDGNFLTFNTAEVDTISACLSEGDDHVLLAGNVDTPAIIHGGADNDFLKAGGGPAVLVGDAGNDILLGGNDRNILIGGLGQDTLVGGAADDVLIGGSTDTDDDHNVLMQALSEWTSNASYANRVSAIDLVLSVQDDGEEDTLIGSGGRDLFYSDLGDILADVKTKKNAETVI